MKRIVYKIFLALTTIEGVVAVFFLLRIPSLERNARFFGYSLGRLGIALAALLLVLLFATLTIRSFIDEHWLERIQLMLETSTFNGERLLVAMYTLSSVMVVGTSLILIWNLPFVHQYAWYASVFPIRLQLYEAILVIFERVMPVLVWLTLVVIQALIASLVVFRERYQVAGFLNWNVISKTTLVLGMIYLSLLQWSVLALGIPLIDLLPGWYWEVFIRSYGSRLVVMPFVLGLALLVVRFILNHPRWVGLSLALVVALGYLFQVGFGFVEGRGYEYIRLKYTNTGHRSYASIAVNDFDDPLAAVRDYEQRYGQKIFPSTKPPGVVLFYILMERLVNSVSPQGAPEGRFLVLTRFMAVVFPLVALLVVGIIYAFTRQLVDPEKAIAPAILFIFIPNVILIPMFLDQALYPLLFMIGVLLLWQVMKSRSLWLAFAAGIYIYVAVFITFAMVPLLPCFVLLVGLDFLQYKNQRLSQPLMLMIGLGMGILVALVLFRLFLNYDILLRYETANRVVRNFDFVLRTGGRMTEDLTTNAVSPGVGQILRAALLNNLEFAAAVGFPVYLLFLWRAVSTVVRLVQRKASELDVTLGALLLTFLALNVYGQMQGEAARLWIFWVPMVVIFGGLELITRFKPKKQAFYLVVTLQLITMWATFMYQDFLV